MDPTKGGKEPKITFGPNIPAAVELLFGRKESQGTLPVDIPIVEDGSNVY